MSTLCLQPLQKVSSNFDHLGSVKVVFFSSALTLSAKLLKACRVGCAKWRDESSIDVTKTLLEMIKDRVHFLDDYLHVHVILLIFARVLRHTIVGVFWTSMKHCYRIPV